MRFHCIDIVLAISIHPLDGHLSCLYFGAIKNNAFMNIRVQSSVWMQIVISLGYMHRVGIAGSSGDFIFNFLRNCETFPQQLYHRAFLPAVSEGSRFSTTLPTLVSVLFFIKLKPSFLL